VINNVMTGVGMERKEKGRWIYDCVMGCRHSWPLICFHVSNIRTITLEDKLIKRWHVSFFMLFSLTYPFFHLTSLLWYLLVSLSTCKVKKPLSTKTIQFYLAVFFYFIYIWHILKCLNILIFNKILFLCQQIQTYFII
jgi:hypothetical protein